MINSPLRRAIVAFCALLLLAVSSMAFDFSVLEESVTEHTLDNGLTLLVMERHQAPVVSFCTWSNVGSVDDPKGYTGMAHMFEHMAFKGSTTLGTKDIDKELELIAIEDSIFMDLRQARNRGRFNDSTQIAELTAAYEAAREASYELVVPNEFGNVIEREGGVGLNAFTSMDETVYFFSLPSNKVELWMALESERFLNPVLREMYKERDVIAEERRMRTESNPIGGLIEEFLAIAFKAHPYGISGIGHMSDIQYYSRDEAKAFFDKYYGPSNLVIAVVGDVDTKEVIKLADKYWGRIPARAKPERIATIEPEQRGERRVVVEDPAQPFFIAGWHIPEGSHVDRPALDALSDYLGQGRTSLLYKNLVKEKKLAMQVGAFGGFPGNKYPGLVAVYAVPTAGHTNDECETEIMTEVKRLRDELLSVEDVEKIKARAKANFIRSLDDNTGLAMALTASQTFWGDWRETFRDLDRINAVTAEDIQRVAQKYLTSKNRVVGVIETEEG